MREDFKARRYEVKVIESIQNILFEYMPIKVIASQQGQTPLVLMSSYQSKAEKRCKKFVALKFLPKETLNEKELSREVDSLYDLLGNQFFLQIHEVLDLEDCTVIVTDFIFGCTIQ